MPNFCCKFSAYFSYISVPCQVYSILTYTIFFEFHSNIVKKTSDRSDCHHFADEDSEASRRLMAETWQWTLAPKVRI